MKDKVRYRHVAGIPGLVLSDALFFEYDFGRHFHLDWHIGLVSRGAQRQRVLHHSQLLRPGDIAIMPPGEVHDGAREGDEAYALSTFRIAPGLLDGLAQEISANADGPQLIASIIHAPELAQQLLTLHLALQEEDRWPAIGVQASWLDLMQQIMELARLITPAAARGLSRMQRQLIRDYCRAHLSEKITLEQLAAQCELDRFQFLRSFKHTEGMTPHAWLLRLRLEHGCLLLAQVGHSLASVAQQVGFYDQSHFSRAFRQAFGITPSGYCTRQR